MSHSGKLLNTSDPEKQNRKESVWTAHDCDLQDKPGEVIRMYGVDNTVSLEDIKDKNFTVTTRARYNVTVVENADCTQVEKQINGTMIFLYEFNPNAENDYTGIIIIVITAVIIVVNGGPPLCITLLDRCC